MQRSSMEDMLWPKLTMQDYEEEFNYGALTWKGGLIWLRPIQSDHQYIDWRRCDPYQGNYLPQYTNGVLITMDGTAYIL